MSKAHCSFANLTGQPFQLRALSSVPGNATAVLVVDCGEEVLTGSCVRPDVGDCDEDEFDCQGGPLDYETEQGYQLFISVSDNQSEAETKTVRKTLIDAFNLQDLAPPVCS